MAFGSSARRTQVASRLLQAAIGAVLLVGLATRNLSVVVNATLALSVTFLPGVLARDYGLTVGPGLVLLLTSALFLHTLGMLGLYDGVWWYDHVTHTLSAMLVAGVGYTVTRAVDRYSEAIYLPDRFLAVYIVLVTLAAGVFWEMLEFLAREFAVLLALEPVLVQYGLGDTLVDLVFDAVGAGIVALFGTERFEGLVGRVTVWLEERTAGGR
ncbi:hypothetical protein [Halorarius halobius]|uniref:hypothetical protein n=1 Tax=Halorarius halobius TaxID=2962671 RepID=UPI0020CD513D|nr:hypothetical protein [Halorarius halobius]